MSLIGIDLAMVRMMRLRKKEGEEEVGIDLWMRVMMIMMMKII